MNSRLIFFVFLLFIFSMPAYASVTHAEKAVTFAVFSRQWPPFEMMDGSTPYGAALDIFKEAMPEGLELKIVTLPKARTVLHPMTGPVHTRIESQKWMGKTFSYWWSDVVLTLKTVLISPAGTPLEYEGEPSLEGLTIGCIRNYTYPSVDPLFKSGKATRYDVNSDLVLLRMVKAGRIDAAVFDYISAEWMIKNSPDLKREDFYIAQNSLDTSDLRFAFNFKPSFKRWIPLINERIRMMQKSGAIERIMNQYR